MTCHPLDHVHQDPGTEPWGGGVVPDCAARGAVRAQVRHLALAGLRRVKLAVGGTFADGQEAARGAIVVPAEEHVAAANRRTKRNDLMLLRVVTARPRLSMRVRSSGAHAPPSAAPRAPGPPDPNLPRTLIERPQNPASPRIPAPSHTLTNLTTASPPLPLHARLVPGALTRPAPVTRCAT